MAFSNTTLSHLWESLPRLDTDSLHCETNCGRASLRREIVLASTGMGVEVGNFNVAKSSYMAGF